MENYFEPRNLKYEGKIKIFNLQIYHNKTKNKMWGRI